VPRSPSGSTVSLGPASPRIYIFVPSQASYPWTPLTVYCEVIQPLRVTEVGYFDTLIFYLTDYR
jgi:hypothetical protein